MNTAKFDEFVNKWYYFWWTPCLLVVMFAPVWPWAPIAAAIITYLTIASIRHLSKESENEND